MKIVYSDQPPPEVFGPSIFLAGPTPRASKPVPSWRPDAIKLMEYADFNMPQMTLFVPEYKERAIVADEDRDAAWKRQVEWEWTCLHGSSVVLFWVPRDLDTLPAFTTNIEFGYYIDKKQTVYGRPSVHPKNAYLDWLYDKVTGKKPFDNLVDAVYEAIKLCRSGMPSCGNG